MVIMACNRAEYLRRALESVLQYHEPYADQFPIYVSQDGSCSTAPFLLPHPLLPLVLADEMCMWNGCGRHSQGS